MFETADLMKGITAIQIVKPLFSDIPLRFVVTMVCALGHPMLVVVDEDELARRRDRRVARS
jgi:hypothetical protein